MTNLRILRLSFASQVCILLILFYIQACSVLQFKKLKTCEFQLERIDILKLDGLDISRFRSVNDLGLLNSAKILQDFAAGSISAEFTLIFKVFNPNASNAIMEKFDYIGLLDNIEIINGSQENRIELPSNKSSEFLVNGKANISEFLKQKSLRSLVELANSLSHRTDLEKRLKIKVRPYICIGKKYLKYPGFVEIKLNKPLK